MKWDASIACSNRLACAMCRRTDRTGRRWRLSLAKVYHLPGNQVNFTCPHGVPWGPGPAPQPEQAPARTAPAGAPPAARGCSGCGGENFQPPSTPDQAEAILREHLQP